MKKPPNKRMQSDQNALCAFILTADAKRYELYTITEKGSHSGIIAEWIFNH